MRISKMLIWCGVGRGLVGLFLILGMSACGGGGSGSKLSLSLSPQTLTGSFQQGYAQAFSVTATVSGKASGTIYVAIIDSDDVLQPGITIRQTGDNTFLAQLTTSSILFGGEHAGTFDVELCGDPNCSTRYGDTKLPYDFNVIPTVPTLYSLDTPQADAGGAPFVLQLNGTGFLSTATVLLNGSPRATFDYSDIHVGVQITAADIADIGSIAITVSNSGGAYPSNSRELTVHAAVPAIITLTPASASTGSAAITLNLDGNDFIPSSVLMWNGSPRPTTYLSSNQITAEISADDLHSGGSDTIAVVNLGADGGNSNTAIFQVINGAPTLSLLNPDSATVAAGGAAFFLTASGSGFVPGSTLMWNGSPRTTTVISGAEVRGQITAVDIATAGTDLVAVSNPTPGGGTSQALTFTVQNPSPTLGSISPNSAIAGGTAFALNVTGSNFEPSSLVQWNGSARVTGFVSATLLTAQITTADLASAGSAAVTVSTPVPGGGTSAPTNFTILHPKPSLGAINASSATAGCPAFSIIALGSNFESSSTVLWNGSPRPTAFISSSQLSAQITAADVAFAATATVTIQNPAPGGGISSGMEFSVGTTGPLTTDAVAINLNVAHTGFATTACPVSFPSTPLWNADLDGVPTGVLIAGGRVFVTTSLSGVGSGLYALNQGTGAVLWGPVIIGGGAYMTYDNGQVFILNSGGVVQAYEAQTGGVQWTTTLSGQYQFTSAPTAMNGLLYAGGGGSGGSLYALLESTGANLWTKAVDNSDSSPAVTSGGVYVAYPCNTYDFDPLLGNQVWAYNAGCGGGGGATPIVANGLLYAAQRFNTSSSSIFNASTGALEGSYTADNPPALTSGYGYFMLNGNLRRVDLSNNSAAWSFVGDNLLAFSPIVVNDFVIVGSQSGKLYALDATSGQTVWTQSVGGGGFAIIAGDGLLVVPSGHSLIAYSIAASK